MKKLFILFAVLSTVVLAGCKKDDSVTVSLSVSPQQIDAPEEGGTFSVKIQSSSSWTASVTGAALISISPSKGDGNATMTVTVTPANGDDKEATGSISVKSSVDGKEATVSVRRAPHVVPHIEIDKAAMESHCDGGSYQVQVKSNVTWTVTTSDETVAVPDYTSGSGDAELDILVYPSINSKDSKATLTLTTKGGASAEVVITRKAMPQQVYQAHSFSIADGKKVTFAHGNVLYQASTETWRFAEQQFFYVGDKTAGFIGVNGVKSDNTKISASYDGWIDLFGFGTGSNPSLSSADNKLYAEFTDWGSNNISNESVQTGWYTMSSSEWHYLLETREKAKQLRGVATVFFTRGYILLPDDWDGSSEVGFTPNANSWEANTYTMAQWQQLEAKGAIFFPDAGIRQETAVQIAGTIRYWSQSGNNATSAYIFSATNQGVNAKGSLDRHCGVAVRLVHD